MDEYFAGFLLDEMDEPLAPGDAFKSVLGSVTFAYVPERGYALTIATRTTNEQGNLVHLEAPMDLENPIYVTLAEASFLPEGSVLPVPFVVVHELGHVFHNRHGGKTGTGGLAPIAAETYAEATESRWYPSGGFVSIDEYNADPIAFHNEAFAFRQNMDDPPKYLNIWGNVTEFPSAYIIPAGRYYPQYGEDENSTFFPNETRPQNPNPSEGFADSLANIVLETIALSVGSSRYMYFNDHVSDWVFNIVAYND